MLKKIPPSDISIRPFKAYKEFNFNQGSSDIKLFTAASDLPYDTTELASNYDTAKTITWAVNDLDVTTFRNGDPIMQITSQTVWLSNATSFRKPAWCYYGMTTTDTNGRGKFYNRFAVTDPRGLAPEGFKIPSRSDFIGLSTVFDAATITPPLSNGPVAISTLSGLSFINSASFGINGYIYLNGTSNNSTDRGYYHGSDTIFTLSGSSVSTAGTSSLSDGFAINPALEYQNSFGAHVKCIRYDADLYTFRKNELYGQLYAQFYNGNEDNPFLRFGSKTNNYNADDDFANERYFGESEAKVLSIPQKYIGEGIKKQSVLLYDSNSNITLSDDGYGNLSIDGVTQVTDVNIDFETGVFTFVYTYVDNTDPNNPITNLITYTTSVSSNTWNMNTGDVVITYNGNNYACKLISLDTNTGVAVFDQIPFLTGIAGSGYVGNVFYNQGLIVITRYTDILLIGKWDLQFKATETIYENEYLLVVGEDEFNVSTNPTAVVSVGEQIEKFTDSDNKIFTVIPYPGAKYVRKQTIIDDGTLLDYGYTGSVSPLTKRVGFEQIEVSSSIDPTGSYLAPFITTIGLYDDDANCVAVAKLPQPIKCLPNIPLNFIVRFDT